jgi:hypothetical protein
MARREPAYIINQDYTVREQLKEAIEQKKQEAIEYIQSQGERGNYMAADILVASISDYKAREQYALKVKRSEVVRAIRNLPFLHDVRIKPVGTTINVYGQIRGLIAVVQNDYRIAYRMPPVEVHLEDSLARIRLFTKVPTKSIALRDFSTENRRTLGMNSRGRYKYACLRRYQANPHCLRVNEICWGDFKSTITELKRSLDYAGILCTIVEYLTAVNGYDSAGSRFRDLLIGDPNIRLYSLSDMGWTRVEKNYPREYVIPMWSPKWSRWGRATTHRASAVAPEIRRFYISPNEYIEGDDIGELTRHNVSYSNGLCTAGRTLCPSLSAPMPDCRSVLRVATTKPNRYPLYTKQERKVINEVSIIGAESAPIITEPTGEENNLPTTEPSVP